MNVKKLNEYFESEFGKLDKSIIATPKTRENLESFCKASGTEGWFLPMQFAMNFGYKMALENVKDEVTNLTKNL